MDGLVCKPSTATMVLDDSMVLKSNSEDLVITGSKPSSVTLSPVNTNFDSKITENNKESINGQVDGSSESLGSHESEKSFQSCEKTASPTLIQHAFNVMKNLFSPEKSKNKTLNVDSSVIQHQIGSTSPNNSIYVLRKPEIGITEDAIETSTGLPVSGEISSKDHVNMNQLGPDSHNNTDDSFLTTVSLIDESFQSAVTHLDENGEMLRNGARLSENFFNNSRDMDPYNDTLDGSDYCLENTTLKNGSFSSDKGQLSNTSAEFPNKSPNGVHCNVGDETVFENTAKDHVSKNHNNEVLKDSPNEFEGKLVPEALASLGNNSGVTTNGYLKNESCILPSHSNGNDLNGHELDKSTMNFLNNSFGKLMNSINHSENGSVELNEVVEGPHTTKVPEETEKDAPEAGKVNPMAKILSSTTVVLQAGDLNEMDNVLLSLKSDDSATNTSSLNSFEEADDMNPLDNLMDCQSEKDPTDLETKGLCENNFSPCRTTHPLNKSGEKNFSKSEGNSPNKLSDLIKPNKSSDDIDQRGLNDPPKKSQEVSCIDMSVPEASGDSVKSTPEVKTIFRTKDSKENFSSVNENFGTGPNKFENEKSDAGLLIDETDSLVSQESYTVLTVNNDLIRPVINSTSCHQDGSENVELNSDLDVDTNKELKVQKTGEIIDGSPNNEKILKTAKQSTPICEGNVKVKEGQYVEGSSSLKPDLLSKAMEIFSKEDSTEASPVVSFIDRQDLFSKLTCELSRVSSQSFPCLNSTFDILELAPKELNKSFQGNISLQKTKKPSNTLNRTFEKGCVSPGMNKLNHTYEKKGESLSPGEGVDSPKLNETYDKNAKSFEKKLNFTFEKRSESSGGNDLNQTFAKKLDSPEKVILNQTYDKKIESPVANLFLKHDKSPVREVKQVPDSKTKPYKLNLTYDKVIESPEVNKLNLTYDKMSDSPNITSLNQTFNVEWKVGEMKSAEPGEINESFDKKKELTQMTTSEGGEAGDINKINPPFEIITTPGSPPLNGGSFGDKNIENLDFGIHKDLLNGSFMSTASSTNSKDQTIFVDDKFSTSPELAQLIKEQFSSKDIEKICSVVDDLSSMKLSSDILRASEQFDKSFHESLSTNNEFKVPSQTEIKPEKTVNPLSPNSFDFLSSIQGKPTGRDFSRESLYVKFDPLVQPSHANSLIDFTKEVEAPLSPLTTEEASPEVSHSNSVCENLLAISPERQPNDIVPPLTPLSHKNKTLSEDKTERLKELQNEIYFLKNLYAERERTNKVKMDGFESQIAKLIGQNCILEDKLKESSEREKSLVKKLKEQTQGLGQLKIIMEEYIKVISKLTEELESVRAESTKQIESLTAEKDSYMTHLQNTEAAFTDVHTKYEKSKKTIINLRTNEEKFRSTIAEQSHKIEEYKEKTKEAQEKAVKDCQKVQEELNETKANHNQETARLRAQLRKTELKLEAMQESLDQKIKENQQLTAICDELIEGKK